MAIVTSQAGQKIWLYFRVPVCMCKLLNCVFLLIPTSEILPSEARNLELGQTTLDRETTNEHRLSRQTRRVPKSQNGGECHQHVYGREAGHPRAEAGVLSPQVLDAILCARGGGQVLSVLHENLLLQVRHGGNHRPDRAHQHPGTDGADGHLPNAGPLVWTVLEAQPEAVLRVLCARVPATLRTAPALDEEVDPESGAVPAGNSAAAACQPDTDARDPPGDAPGG
uniref:(northern house mosquito) hypothetical protein n=1 Tax=Culex pipiens TaxID=7175 RepID=A0A8D8BL01_CULPI